MQISSFALLKVMAVGGFEGHSVEGFELLDFFQGLRGEGSLAFEGVKDDAFEKVAEGHVFLFGNRFEDLEHAFFEADAGLHAFDFDERMVLLFRCHVYQCTKVLRYYQSCSLVRAIQTRKKCRLNGAQFLSRRPFLRSETCLRVIQERDSSNRGVACYGRFGRRNESTI